MKTFFLPSKSLSLSCPLLLPFIYCKKWGAVNFWDLPAYQFFPIVKHIGCNMSFYKCSWLNVFRHCVLLLFYTRFELTLCCKLFWTSLCVKSNKYNKVYMTMNLQPLVSHPAIQTECLFYFLRTWINPRMACGCSGVTWRYGLESQ